MMKRALSIWLLVVLTAGSHSFCLAEEIRTKWEYRCIDLGVTDIRDFQDDANKLGEEGWEMVGGAGTANNFHTTQLWCFKREKKIEKGQ